MKQRFSKYMRYYERNLILILMLFSVSVMQAQNRTVKGTVTDVQGEPIIGANVVIVGGTKGVITDLDGKYSIQVPENGAVLNFSYIGFKTTTRFSTTLRTPIAEIIPYSMKLTPPIIAEGIEPITSAILGIKLRMMA